MNGSKQQDTDWPLIRTVGFDGLLVSFGDTLSEPANRAALAFRSALEVENWDGIEETSTSLVSTYLRFDPLALTHSELRASLETLLMDRNWYETPLPTGRTLWRVPTAFGGTAAPQLTEAASAAGLCEAKAIASITSTQVRVQTIGFAPGMPYLGELPDAWNIPRQTNLTDQVPAGGLCVAIRQLVLFPVATPTGWRHIGQTALQLFRPDVDDPFLLRPGDEVIFYEVTHETLSNMTEDPLGGATCEALK